ncbi:MAG: AI-2E family transporter, partial [Propionibacteriaceae bacterium]|nr:AI-2E family transporter [Propionibacteriaceae bacterium]
AATVVVFLGLLAGVAWLVVGRLAAELEGLRTSVVTELDRVEEWLAETLPVGSETVREALDQVEEWVIGNQGTIFDGALTVGTSAVTIVAGGVIALLGTFFLLAQGDRVWAWFIDLLNDRRAERLHEAGRRGWVTLSTYIKMQVLIAGIDAVAIGIGAFFLGLPFLLPLVLITFVLCIIPFIGAFVSGALFVLVALFTDGAMTALIMLLIVIAVQQLESDLLSPFLMGQAVNLHPLALLVGTTAGVYLVGIAGALFVVPVLAVANTVRLYLSGDDMFPQLDCGGSALTGSAKKLSRGRETKKLPKRVGEALPAVARTGGPSRTTQTDDRDTDPEAYAAPTTDVRTDEPTTDENDTRQSDH